MSDVTVTAKVAPSADLRLSERQRRRERQMRRLFENLAALAQRAGEASAI